MNLKDIILILSGKSQSQKDKYCMIPPYMSYFKKSDSEKEWSVGCQQLEEGKTGSY